MAPRSLTQKILAAHGAAPDGDSIALTPRQVLLQDATGTLVIQALAAKGLDRVRVDLAVQYVDHNHLQADVRNADDHT